MAESRGFHGRSLFKPLRAGLLCDAATDDAHGSLAQ